MFLFDGRHVVRLLTCQLIGSDDVRGLLSSFRSFVCCPEIFSTAAPFCAAPNSAALFLFWAGEVFWRADLEVVVVGPVVQFWDQQQQQGRQNDVFLTRSFIVCPETRTMFHANSPAAG